MTLGEFKAWLDGYSAGIGEAPTAEQWETVKRKLAEVARLPDWPVYRGPVLPSPQIVPQTVPGYPHTTCGGGASTGARARNSGEGYRTA